MLGRDRLYWKKRNDENGSFSILEAMIDDCVFNLNYLYNPSIEKEQVSSTWEKMNLMLETFDDLENKIIILGGDFNLFLDSIHEAEGGSPILKKSCFKTHFHWEYIYELDLCQICKAFKNHR